MFDDDDGISSVREPVEDIEQFLNIRKMETRRGFIQNVDALPCLPLAQFPRELNPLGLSARERCGRLT